MLKVLQVVAGLGGGGVASLIKNYYSNMDHSRVTFDFIVHGSKIYMNEQYFLDLGSKVFHVTPAAESVSKHFLEIDNVIKTGHYDVIHIHQGGLSWPILFIAMLHGVKVRIAHSHIAFEGYLTPKRKLFAGLSKAFATDLWACGQEAGITAWGKSQFYVLNNAVSYDNFAFNPSKRSSYRETLGVSESCKCVFHIGRYTDQKNHTFVIEIAKRLKRKDGNFKIFLVGDGPDYEKINRVIDECDLRDIIITLGLRDDVSSLISAMDVMILPSLYEGLPVVMVEAQCNGLPIVAADTITREVSLLDNVQYLPLTDAERWADTIAGETSRKSEQAIYWKIEKAGYDIAMEGPRLVDKYYEISR